MNSKTIKITIKDYSFEDTREHEQSLDRAIRHVTQIVRDFCIQWGYKESSIALIPVLSPDNPEVIEFIDIVDTSEEHDKWVKYRNVPDINEKDFDVEDEGWEDEDDLLYPPEY